MANFVTKENLSQRGHIVKVHCTNHDQTYFGYQLRNKDNLENKINEYQKTTFNLLSSYVIFKQIFVKFNTFYGGMV